MRTLFYTIENGYITKVSYLWDFTQNREYNDYGELDKVSDNSFSYEITERYPDGSIKQKQETLNGTTVTYDYLYDNMGRLTEVQKENVIVETYTYDANGNRETATTNGTNITSTDYTLDDSLKVYGQNSYLYNEDGYLQTKTTPEGTSTYTYGTAGELKSVTTLQKP